MIGRKPPLKCQRALSGLQEQAHVSLPPRASCLRVQGQDVCDLGWYTLPLQASVSSSTKSGS